MKKINWKNLIIIILMGIASFGIINDFIKLMAGATYTWFGVITALINISILGLGLDEIKKVACENTNYNTTR